MCVVVSEGVGEGEAGAIWGQSQTPSPKHGGLHEDAHFQPKTPGAEEVMA